MSCVGNTCGVGGVGILPGDPSNNGVLSATPAFGGIDVTWTLPTLNPFAVAHTIVYRSLTENFVGAIAYATVAGTFFHDRVDSATRYYYWIKFVSVNGTEGELIGPASAVARPMIEDFIEILTGKIDRGVLAQALKTEIDRITTINTGLTQEIADRFGADSALAQSVNALASDVDGVVNVLTEEVVRRQTADESLVDAVSVVGARVNGAMSAIIEESTVRASTDEALANRITTIESSAGGANAAIQQEATTRANADTALAGQITTAQSTLNGQISQVQTNLQTNINGVNEKVTSIGALYTVKLNVNGLIGGYGVYNNGTVVQAGFDVDTFWVGRTNADMRKPFIVEGGVTYLDDAVINKLTFAKLRDASGNFVVDENGRMKSAYINTSGITVSSANGGGLDIRPTTPDRVEITNKGIGIYVGNQIRGFFGDDS